MNIYRSICLLIIGEKKTKLFRQHVRNSRQHKPVDQAADELVWRIGENTRYRHSHRLLAPADSVSAGL
jgi:hypothetical protein